jgi:DNA replication and repair protein RecF
MLTNLRLQNFRSYEDASFEINRGVNIIVGPNASGKTNLLEAVLVLARGNSYRARDQELVRFNQPWGRLDCVSEDGAHRTVKITTDPTPGKTYELDEKIFKRLSLNHTLPVVLFEPEHLRLLTGGPERRRDYLDDLLEQAVPGFGVTRRQYRRALTQRNSLLKQFRVSPQAFFPWNVRLSQLAGQIVRARVQLTNQINENIRQLYRELSKTKTEVKVVYAGRWPGDSYESQLLERLESTIEDDKARGFTGSGPHREDLQTLFNDRPVAETASRGEVRTAVLALKVIELQLLESMRGKTPVLLLDDVFSELDSVRRLSLTDFVKSYQTFITTTDADIVKQQFAGSSNIIAL